MNRLCYISRNYASLKGAGSKAKTDNEQTLRQMGAVNLGLPTTHYDNMVLTFLLNLAGVLRLALAARRHDVIVLQYPVKKYFSFLCRAAHWRGAKVVTIVHDLTALHRHRVTIEKEISRLMRSDHVIASNEAMMHWLKENGLSRPITPLGLFDYRSDARPAHRSTTLSLVYAGALTPRKNAYLPQLASSPMGIKLHVYGNCDALPGLQQAPHAVCHPFAPADEFIRQGEGDFGLVWDGDSLETCQGDFGQYLRYNSPHKVSFYLRAGKPVVIWQQAAVAPIIEREGIGLLISSLDQLQQTLEQLTPQQMAAMNENVSRISDKLSKGGFLQEALQKVLPTL